MSNVQVIRDGVDTAPPTAWFEARLPEVAGASPVPSPCANICKIDPASDVCLGCRRTLAEIAAWSRMSDADKRIVWLQLPGRDPGKL
jgi:uncharacterized protein